jgi:hypothetical protein
VKTLHLGPKVQLFLYNKGEVLKNIKQESKTNMWINREANEIYVVGTEEEKESAHLLINEVLDVTMITVSFTDQICLD